MTVLTEVLPPPCKTSLGSRPSKRGGVDVQREVAPDSLGGIALDHALGIRTRPQALHSRHPMSMTA